MNKEERKVPELRFKGFHDDWEQRKLNSLVENVGTGRSSFKTGKTKSLKYPYPVLGSTNIISYDENYDHSGKFILTARVGANAGNLYYFQGNVKISDNTVYIQTENWEFTYNLILKFNLKKLSFGTGQPLIKASEIKKINLLTPHNNKEQLCIGLLLTRLDSIITLHQRKINILLSIKKAYLNAVFPLQGENTPRLRFNYFTEEWEQRKFKDFSDKSGKKNSKEKSFPAYSVSNKHGLMRQSNQFEDSRLESLEKSSYKIVYPNEFVYNPSRINVGSIGFNDLNIPLIVSSLYVIVKMKESIDNTYILQFMKSQVFNREVNKNTEGSVREYLFFENFKNIRFPYAKNIKEQQQVGLLLKNIDDTITLHQSKLESLTKLKQVYLNKMFI